jgi:hypothetical protein
VPPAMTVRSPEMIGRMTILVLYLLSHGGSL